ncbi:hypothetical protein LTR65_006047 [Meristemomyces frigidus]
MAASIARDQGANQGTMECVVCANSYEDHAEIVLVDGASVCRGCIIGMFQRAVDNDDYPVTWGAHVVLHPDDYGRVVPAALRTQFRERQKELEEEALACKRAEEADAAAFEGLVRGKDYQLCPNKRCGRRIQLEAGCNHIYCLCSQQFCFVCGEPATNASLHWASLGPEDVKCPRYNQPTAANAIYDGVGPLDMAFGFYVDMPAAGAAQLYARELRDARARREPEHERVLQNLGTAHLGREHFVGVAGRRNALVPEQDEAANADVEAGATISRRRARNEQLIGRVRSRDIAVGEHNRRRAQERELLPNPARIRRHNEHLFPATPHHQPPDHPTSAPSIGDVPPHPMLSPTRFTQTPEAGMHAAPYGRIPTPRSIAARTRRGFGVGSEPQPLRLVASTPHTRNRMMEEQLPSYEQVNRTREQPRLNQERQTREINQAQTDREALAGEVHAFGGDLGTLERRIARLQGRSEQSMQNTENLFGSAQDPERQRSSRLPWAARREPISADSAAPPSSTGQPLDRAIAPTQPGGLTRPSRGSLRPQFPREEYAGRGNETPHPAYEYGNPRNLYDGVGHGHNPGSVRRLDPVNLQRPHAPRDEALDMPSGPTGLGAGRPRIAVPPRSSSLRAQAQTFQQSNTERFRSELQTSDRLRGRLRELDRSISTFGRRV